MHRARDASKLIGDAFAPPVDWLEDAIVKADE
jgi:hypothetical protein